ncbi:helix-turn-helix domain-containing protein [Saccharopolyspora griseoalba]|uniref:Helix-turn-helix domain-containing protein n=1 Tax=Saccharopolyspora griseoalba TaxID=1431848 RepID=A0ABW2LQQ9_9PSEU
MTDPLATRTRESPEHIAPGISRAEERFAEALPLAELAAAVSCSPRTLTRSFVRATGLTPLRCQHALRLERAEHLLDRGATAESAARSVGFADARMLRRIREREVPQSPGR